MNGAGVNLAVTLLGQRVTLVELVGNVCALASVRLAQRRTVWSWIVQLAGDGLMLVVFARAHLAGNAAKQVVFVALAAYGWVRWQRRGVREPRRMSAVGRVGAAAGLVAFAAACAGVLAATGTSVSPVPDGWIFAAAIAANMLMALGYTEFWWCWLGVNAVGVPLCLTAHLYITTLTFGIFTAMAVGGLRAWNRQVPVAPAPARTAEAAS